MHINVAIGSPSPSDIYLKSVELKFEACGHDYFRDKLKDYYDDKTIRLEDNPKNCVTYNDNYNNPIMQDINDPKNNLFLGGIPDLKNQQFKFENVVILNKYNLLMLIMCYMVQK